MSVIWSWAVVGRKVVCIRTQPILARGYQGDAPVLHQIYVIRETHIAPWGDAMLALEGIKSNAPMGPYWPIECFRPAVEPKADNEIEARLFRQSRNRKGVDA